MVNKEQIYDLYIAGYKIIEISNIVKCNEKTVRRKLKEFREEKNKKYLEKLKLLGIDIELIDDNIKINTYKTIHNKAEIIQLYLDGYTAKDIELEKSYRRDDVYNIIRRFKREVGFQKFSEIYAKIHKRNREKLLLERKRERYNRDLMKLTGQEVKGYLSDLALHPLVKSAYEVKDSRLVLSNESKKIATWDLPRVYK